MRVAPKIDLTGEEKIVLEKWTQGRETAVRVAGRARIVLLAANGGQDLQIASQLKISPRKASRWRQRFPDQGLAGLEKDAPRPGRTPSIARETVAKVVRLTTQDKPGNATHWSTRSMAATVGISDSSVLRIWHARGLKPHRIESFKLSNDSDFAEKTGGHRRVASPSSRARHRAVCRREEPSAGAR